VRLDLSPDLVKLATGPKYRFADWPNPAVARQPGVYTIWDGERLLYVGMAGRAAKASVNPMAIDPLPLDEPKVIPELREIAGLWHRLNSHASGRRSSDQFCVYICDRFVVAGLTPEEQVAVRDARLSLDAMTKTFIREALDYRFVATADAAGALTIEAAIRCGRLPSGPPFLNPDLRRR